MSTMVGVEALGQDELNQLLAEAQTRGDYRRYMENFINSGDDAWRVSTDEGPFAGKRLASIKSGFETVKNAKNPPDGVQNVRVLTHKEQVYLLRQATGGSDGNEAS